ncbi:MAG: hypothetical protein ACRDIC_05830 [bacterium]
MPIDIFCEEMDWEAETAGPAPTRVLAGVRDDQSLVEQLLSDLDSGEFPYLGFISQDTVTVFHQHHFAQLVKELEALSARKHDPQVAKHLHTILQLISAARGPKDTLIAFRVR